MIDRFFQDRGIGCDRSKGVSRRFNRIRRDKSAVYSLEEAVDGKPRIEWGVGNYEKIKEMGREYENEYPPDSPFVMLHFYDVSDKRYGFAKVYFGDSKEVRTALDYVNELNKAMIECMTEKNPNPELRWDISVHGWNRRVSELLYDYVRKKVIENYE